MSKPAPPVKKSIFERQKEEAEARRAKEKAETDAVYEDFVKSFEDDGLPSSYQGRANTHAGSGAGFTVTPGRRHFTSSGLKSGPGTLGSGLGASRSGPGSLGVSSNFGRKRPYDDFTGGQRERNHDRDWEVDRGYGAYQQEDLKRDDHLRHSREDPKSKDDDEESKEAAKPTLRLSSLPPSTSAAVVKALFAASPLSVDHVRILPSTHVPSTERKSASAIVTLAAETPAADVDAVVSQMQNQYLGCGYTLSISRHLSSAVASETTDLSGSSSILNNLPFGAKVVVQHQSLSRAPPPGQRPGRFAPPSSYGPYSGRSNQPQTQVVVQSPTDLKQLKLIHKTIEALLTYGPEFEALLMSRPHVQQDEKWSWLWNSRSTEGVYYRWRLWDILTNNSRQAPARLAQSGQTLFDGQSPWVAPAETLRFEYTTNLAEFVDDQDYNSSDEEGDDEGGLARRYNDHNASGAGGIDQVDGAGYLNPLSRTKLVHLLSRLPDSNSKLRKGDVARITAFAIEHAGAGAEEAAALITRNVLKPFISLVSRKDDDSMDGVVEEDQSDQSPASLVGLYIISDILSASASAGVRHAWRYRSMFETCLRNQQVFAKLGRFEQKLSWGKLKSEKWKRSVQAILALWEGWCVFPQSSHDEFVQNFLQPPLTEEERLRVETEERKKADEEAMRGKNVSRWRSVQEDESAVESVQTDDMDGTAMKVEDDDEMDEDIDGMSMEDSSDEEQPRPLAMAAAQELPEEGGLRTAIVKTDVPVARLDQNVALKKQRPRAIDMFADDSE